MRYRNEEPTHCRSNFGDHSLEWILQEPMEITLQDFFELCGGEWSFCWYECKSTKISTEHKRQHDLQWVTTINRYSKDLQIQQIKWSRKKGIININPKIALKNRKIDAWNVGQKQWNFHIRIIEDPHVLFSRTFGPGQWIIWGHELLNVFKTL